MNNWRDFLKMISFVHVLEEARKPLKYDHLKGNTHEKLSWEP